MDLQAASRPGRVTVNHSTRYRNLDGCLPFWLTFRPRPQLARTTSAVETL